MKFLILSLCSLFILSCTGGTKKGSVKDTYFRVLQSEPGDLHPLRSNDAVMSQMILQHDYYGSNIVETLLTKNLDTYEPFPNLATSWEVNDDRTEFTFKLREDVKFHDGSMMTAEDVKFSFDAIFDDTYEAFVARSYYGNIDKAEVVDKYTVKFTVTKPYYLNLTILGELRVIPKNTYSKQTAENRFSKTAVGSGAYKLENWDQGRSLTLVSNPDWWGHKDGKASKRYNFKRIVFKFVSESTLRLAMLERGTVDYDDSVRAEDFVKKMDESPWGESVLKVKADNKVPKKLSYIGWNNNHPIFKDKNVRKALSHLVNRNFINKKFYYGMNSLATGPFRLQSDYAPKIDPITFNTEKAKKLLNDSGWADTDKDGLLDKVIDGQKKQLTFNLISSNKDTEKILTVIKEDMKKAGVEMQINTVDWNALVKAKNERKFDAIIMAWGGGGVDPDPTQIWHSKSAEGIGSNYIGYKNEKVDKLIEKGIKIIDRNKRIKVFHEIHKLIAADAPYTFLFEEKYELYAVSSRVQRPKDTFNYSIGPHYWSLPAN